jgi:nitrite reductase (NADH) small subunit
VPWVSLFPLEALREGAVCELKDRTGSDLLACRAEGQVFVLDNECPHAGGPLAMGNFAPPYLSCPWHAWEFDCRTGECAHQPAVKVRTHPVEIRDGQVWADLPAAITEPASAEADGGK